MDGVQVLAAPATSKREIMNLNADLIITRFRGLTLESVCKNFLYVACFETLLNSLALDTAVAAANPQSAVCPAVNS